MGQRPFRTLAIASSCLFVAALAQAADLPVLDFSSDPQWEGRNNVPGPDVGRDVTQDFGWSATDFCGKGKGEIGGQLFRSLTPSYYAMPIAQKTLGDHLSVSGTFAVTHSEGGSGILIGWFNSASRGWRTPNSLAMRIDGESGKFRIFFEYGTRHWMTGSGQTFEGIYQTTKTPMFVADGTRHSFTLTYDPAGANGQGEMVLVLDGKTYRAPLDPGHKEDGAVFDGFGVFNQQITGDALSVYFDDLEIDGGLESFNTEPQWEGKNNRTAFRDIAIRPYHNFGYRPTTMAGGAPGEIGGLVWRIESTLPEQSAYYAAPTERLSLDVPLHASGKVSMTAASADSAVLIGWFNKETFIGAPPAHFLGVLIEGPSRIGHYFRPAFCSSDGIRAVLQEGPVIQPDSVSHEWTIEYDPAAKDGAGAIVVTLDDQKVALDLTPEARKGNAAFNRFGMLTWNRGGHFVEVYLDDLAFTSELKP
ncbi:MAG: hypothetical protein IT365_23070 [Candidatus Hydrogenedentes bacterium]|nr:hypothetical protein [Candidatus Hydrogenedentota bacterium]